MADFTAAGIEATRPYFSLGIKELENKLGELNTEIGLRALREELLLRIGDRPLPLRARHRILVADIDRAVEELNDVRVQAQQVSGACTQENASNRTFPPPLVADPEGRWFREHPPKSTWWIWRACGILTAAILAGLGHAMGGSLWEAVWPLLKPFLGNKI